MELTSAEWIFFDMGYTLICEDQAHIDRLAKCMDVTDEVITTYFAITDRLAAEGARAPLAYAVREMTGIRKLPRYSRGLEEAFPYSADVLAKLHKNYHIGIIANQTGGAVKRLRKYGLIDHIDCVYSSEEVGLFKPSVEFFRSATRAVACAPEKCIMVGDRPDNDIAPAKACGMMTIRVRQGGFRCFETTDPAATPDADLTDIREMPELLKK